MATKVIMPQLGLTATEGTVVKWLKQEGDKVKKAQPLVEVQTDKVNFEVEAPEEGILLKIVAPEGTIVPVTNLLGWIGEPIEGDRENSQSGDLATPQGATANGTAVLNAPREQAFPKSSPAARKLAREHGIELAEITGTGPRGRIVAEDVQRLIEKDLGIPLVEEEVRASPLARNLAKRLGIDHPPLTGTRPRAAITKEDVELAARMPKTEARGAAQLSQTTQPSPRPTMPKESDLASTSVSLIGLRRTIAQRMALSAQTVARVTLTTEADVTELAKMRDYLVRESEKRHGIRISYTDLIIMAAARALRQHPMMNARLLQDEIQLLDEVNIGIAVAVPQGLIVPVVHNVDAKGLISIARETMEKAERARAGDLTPDDVAGGTFTVTNLGIYEIDAFTPIVNVPETGILGVGRINEKPIVFEGEITKRAMMFLSLSFDHRVIDGAPAADFLCSLKHTLENPCVLLV